ncbi:MAG: hypothetical protein M5U19_15300 [Microthrixaceae bacterium]|nr:hypothetical protein [Microthrixaceae bacterium]
MWVDGDPVDPARSTSSRPRHVTQLLTIECTTGQHITIEKIAAVYTSADDGIYSPVDAATQAVQHAEGFGELLERHVISWAHAWNRSSIELSGDVGHTARVLNLHIFHLLQTVSKNTTDLDAGVPARGLHGEAYRGHIFWDELFIFPLMTMAYRS